MNSENHQRVIDKSVPAQYAQPVRGYIGRTVNDTVEDVDYVPGTHIRIWYNCQMEGYDTHHHKAIEIITCVENGYTVYANGRTYVLNNGDVIIISPGLLHRLPGGKQGARFIMLLDPSPIEGFRELSALGSLFMEPLLISASGSGKLYSRVHDLVLHMVSLYFENKSMWELNIYSDLFAIYSAIGSDHFSRTSFSNSKGTDNVNYEKFTNLMRYIDEHYAEDITLESAADYVGFSKYHFSRLFKEFAGTTFYDVLRRKRIQAAQSLLSTSMSISDIAYQTGFTSLASFGRCFKEQTGMTPSNYRAVRESFSGHISDYTADPESD